MWGEPDPERVLKEKNDSFPSKSVPYSGFNTKSNVWWEQQEAKFGYLKAQIVRLDNDGIEQLTAMTQRNTMDLSVLMLSTEVTLLLPR